MRGSIQGVLAGLISALLVAFLLMPVSGVDTEPPVCFSALGYSVPCGPGWGLGAAAVVWALPGRKPVQRARVSDAVVYSFAAAGLLYLGQMLALGSV